MQRLGHELGAKLGPGRYPLGVIKPQVRDILMRHLCPRQEIIIENAPLQSRDNNNNSKENGNEGEGEENNNNNDNNISKDNNSSRQRQAVSLVA